MTAAEAMACGTPLVVSKRAGITKYLKSGSDCLIVNAASKKDMAWAFRVLNRNESLHMKLSQNGLKVAREKFGWTTIAEKSVSHYKSL